MNYQNLKKEDLSPEQDIQTYSLSPDKDIGD